MLRSSLIYQQSTGQCHIFVGPMYSGKTGRLNAELTRLADSTTFKVLRVGYADDIRSTAGKDPNNLITSHSSSFRGLSQLISIQTVKEISEVNIDGFDVIGIDEAQFYRGIKDVVLDWLDDGKIVYLSSLDGYSSGEVCGEVTALLPYAQTFEKLRANCYYCIDKKIIRPAIMTVCTIDKTNSVDVGGTDKYRPACYACHKKHNIS